MYSVEDRRFSIKETCFHLLLVSPGFLYVTWVEGPMLKIPSLKEADITVVEYGKSCCLNVCIYRSSLLGFGKNELGVGLVASTLS